MSKTKRSGDRARIAALEKQVRQLRAGIRKDILHAVRAEAERREHERTGLVPLGDVPFPVFHRIPTMTDLSRSYALGPDSYSEAEG